MPSQFQSVPVHPSEITPKHVYLSRRDFIKAAGVLAGSMVLAACAPAVEEELPPPDPSIAAKTDELGDPVNTYADITNYNNYYEFTTDKRGVAQLARDFPTSPWEVEIGGLVRNPGKIGVEDLVKKYPPEERIYRLRCVEARSMVIPWLGFPLWSCSAMPNRPPMPDTSVSHPFTSPNSCPGSANPGTPGRTARACAWTKPCTT